MVYKPNTQDISGFYRIVLNYEWYCVVTLFPLHSIPDPCSWRIGLCSGGNTYDNAMFLWARTSLQRDEQRFHGFNRHIALFTVHQAVRKIPYNSYLLFLSIDLLSKVSILLEFKPDDGFKTKKGFFIHFRWTFTRIWEFYFCNL